MKKKETVQDFRMVKEKEQVLESLINEFNEEFSLIKFNSQITGYSGLIIHSVLFSIHGTNEISERVFLTKSKSGLLVAIDDFDIGIMNDVFEQVKQDTGKTSIRIK